MSKHDNFRINIFFVLVLIVSGLILYRLFILSYIRHSVYSRTAAAQRDNITNILARGNIYLKDPTSNNLFLAATNKKFPLAYVVPDNMASSLIMIMTCSVRRPQKRRLPQERLVLLKTLFPAVIRYPAEITRS